MKAPKNRKELEATAARRMAKLVMSIKQPHRVKISHVNAKPQAHTPGPWSVSQAFAGYVAGPDGNYVAVVNGGKKGSPIDAQTRNANESLIAAAPDLLEAAEAAYRVSLLPGAPKDHGHATHFPLCFMCQLRAAIAKAQGQ